MADQQGGMFSAGDAQRINSAVRAHESGRGHRNVSKLPRGGGGGGGDTFRVALFTGAWLKNTPKVVRFSAATNETTSAQNIFGSIAAVAPNSLQRKVGLAQEGTTWIVIAAECS